MSRIKQEKQNQSVLTLLFNICITFSFRFHSPKGPIGKSTLDILLHFLVQNQEFDKWNIFHRESIIAFSPSIFELRPTNHIGEMLVASIVTSLQVYVSSAKWDLGAAKWTFWLSKRFRNSCQDIISGDHRKSLMNITSTFSAPTKAYLELDGLVNASKMAVIGLSIVVFPEFVGT